MSARTGGRRKLLVGILTVGLTLGASAAYAFWTSDGTSSGLASTGTDGTGTVQVTQIGSPSGLVPGGPAQQISLQVLNADPNPVFVQAIKIEVDPTMNVDPDSNPATPPCTAADFLPVNATVGFTMQGNTSYNAFGTIKLIDKPKASPSGPDATDPNNQDACKNVDVDLIFTPLYS